MSIMDKQIEASDTAQDGFPGGARQLMLAGRRGVHASNAVLREAIEGLHRGNGGYTGYLTQFAYRRGLREALDIIEGREKT